MGNSLKAMKLFNADLIKDMLNLGHEVFLSTPDSIPEIVDYFSTLGAQVNILPFSRTGTNPLSDLIYCWKNRQLIKKIQPDLLFAYTHKPIIWGSLAAHSCSVPHIVTMFTGLGYAFTQQNGIKRKLVNSVLKALLSKSLKYSKTIFFLNNDDANLFHELRLIPNSSKVVLINGTGVNTDYYYPMEKKNRDIVFLMIARILEDKGIKEYVEAARQVKKVYPEVRFQLVGGFDTNPSGIRPEKVYEWALEGVIEYLGEVEDVRPYVAESSVFVLPSYREGLSRSIQEAMAMEKAIITTNVPGCRETVCEGENGFLIEAKDASSLAEACIKFIQKPILIDVFGQRSREIAEEQFDVKKINQLILEELGLLTDHPLEWFTEDYAYANYEENYN